MEKRKGIKGRRPNVGKSDEAKGGMITMRCTKEVHCEIIDRAASVGKSINRYMADLVDADLQTVRAERSTDNPENGPPESAPDGA